MEGVWFCKVGFFLCVRGFVLAKDLQPVGWGRDSLSLQGFCNLNKNCKMVVTHCYSHCEQLNSAFLQNLMRGNLGFLRYFALTRSI